MISRIFVILGMVGLIAENTYGTAFTDATAETFADTLVINEQTAKAIFLKENLALLAARFHLEASEADLVAAKLLPNPQLSVNTSYINLVTKPIDYSSEQTSFRLDQTIELGGKRSRRIDEATHSVESAKADFQDAIFQLLNDVKEAFLNVAFEQKSVALSRNDYELFAKSVEAAQLRFKAGDIGEAELKKLELAQLDYQQRLSDAEQDYIDAISSFRQMLNLSPNIPLIINYNFRPSLILPAQDSLLTIAFSNREDLISEREKTLMKKSRIDLAYANAFPDLTIGVELDRQGPDFRNTFGGGIGIAIPVFNRNQNDIQRSEAEYQAATLDEKAKENLIVNSVAAAYTKYQNSWNVVHTLSESTLKNADDVRAMAVKSYNTGNTGLVDFLEAERIYNDAVQGYYNALKKLATNQVELERVIGKEIFNEVPQ
jgi:cobalt-zinc-cadmium efflux system outer membrane protein